MTSHLRRVLAASAATALLLTACGGSDTTTEPDGSDTPSSDASESSEPVAADFQACEVTDTGGVDDRSFNQTAYAGALMAEAELEGVQAFVAESQQTADFEPNINAFLEQDCDIIVTVGFLLGDATEAAAQANPDSQFAIVDYAYDADYPNLREMVFNTDEAALLAGYAAASVTETGTVGTFGGLNIPTVTIFMDGFLKGVNLYNSENGTDVEVKGWDGSDGLFTGDFEDEDKGRQFTQSLIDEGADIILPVAGPVGNGAIAAAKDNDGVKIIWVDTDGCVSTDGCDVILTSIKKNMDVAVFEAIADIVDDGAFATTFYVGTLANDGVGIADFVTFPIDAEVEARIAELRQEIIDGSLVLADL